jgi:membrane dipeptidase
MEGCQQKELAEACSVEPPTMTVLLKNMEQKGLVYREKKQLPGGFRAYGIFLTEEGKKLILRAIDMGIIIDCSHMSDRGFYQLCALTDKPFLATHSNYRTCTGAPRNLTDDMARELASRGGLAGINIYPPFLSDGSATVDDILRHTDYALEHFGERFVAFGGDIDGTDGKYPAPLSEKESIHDALIDAFLKRYPERVVRRIAGENVVEFLIKNLK